MAFVQRVHIVWRYAGLSFLTLFLFLITLRAALAVSHGAVSSSGALLSPMLIWFVLGLGVFNVLVVLVVLLFALQRRKKKKRESELLTQVLAEQPAQRSPKQRSMR